jgi:hypothetical protein
LHEYIPGDKLGSGDRTDSKRIDRSDCCLWHSQRGVFRCWKWSR